MIPLTVGSLFSGIGGFELGLERTGGFKTVWQCEIDPFCQKILEKHWPDVKRFTDIKKMGIEEGIPHVNVICGGFPCQDISCAGKGAGIHAERSGLWWEMLRIIRLVGPRYILVENVAALLNRGLDEVLGSLAESGYDSEWDCLPASAFGAPHQRDRLFVVAYPTGSIYGTKQEREREMLGGSKESLGDGKNRQVAPTSDAIGHQLRQQQRGQRRSCGQGASEPGDDGQIRHPTNATKLGLSRRTVLSATTRQARRFRPEGDNPWSAESGICGVSYGVPDRVDRLRALGNAIVPQCAQFMGQCVLDFIGAEA